MHQLDSTMSAARGLGKRSLAWSPRLYDAGKRTYVTTRTLLDRCVFMSRHRSAAYVSYSRRKLARLADAGYHSQYGQDYFLWNSVLDRQPGGFFIDIGGNDPIKLSNSYFLEQQGWDGLAFDPLARMEQRWRERRSATFHRAAIAESAGYRSFVEIMPREGWEHALSGFRDCVRPEDMALYDHREYDVRTAPIGQFEDDIGSRDVDLVLIDVEGAESSVVAGLDLERVRPRHVVIENVSEVGGGEAVRTVMRGHGYALVARIGSADDVFSRLA